MEEYNKLKIWVREKYKNDLYNPTWIDYVDFSLNNHKLGNCCDVCNYKVDEFEKISTGIEL